MSYQVDYTEHNDDCMFLCYTVNHYVQVLLDCFENLSFEIHVFFTCNRDISMQPNRKPVTIMTSLEVEFKCNERTLEFH